MVVLTKADLHADPDRVVAEVETIAGGVPVLAISSVSGDGLDVVRSYLAPGTTAALLGSSGVGKSTLVNTLAGEELLETQEIREDGKGRHTTTRRELVQLPSGALVIDTPGMRELQLWVADEALEETFDDVTSLFEHCRFSDCAHDASPAAPSRARSRTGRSPERWESYLKLQAELAHLERRLDKRAVAEERRRWKSAGAAGREAVSASRAGRTDDQPPDLTRVEHRHPCLSVDAADHGGVRRRRDDLEDRARDRVEPRHRVDLIVRDPHLVTDQLEVHGVPPTSTFFSTRPLTGSRRMTVPS